MGARNDVVSGAIAIFTMPPCSRHWPRGGGPRGSCPGCMPTFRTCVRQGRAVVYNNCNAKLLHHYADNHRTVIDSNWDRR